MKSPTHNNNKKLDELITRAISRDKPQFDFDKWKNEHQKEIQIFKSQITDRQISQSVQPFKIWRMIMKTGVTKLAATVIIAIGVLLVLNHLVGNGNGKVYGMSDVPGLLYTARTIHMKGKIYFPEEKQAYKQTFVQTEHWLDLKNGRWRLIIPSTCSSPEGFTINVHEDICDGGQYELSIDHTNRQAYFTKISEFQRQLFNRKNTHAFLQLLCSNPAMTDEYKKVGQEIIKGKTYDIWEAVFPQPGFDFTYKVYNWLSPETGEFAKIIIWLQQTGEDRQKKLEIDLVERNTPMNDEVFKLQVPEGYELKNTKEIAQEKPVMCLSGAVANYQLIAHLLFVLPDGSLILCWSSEDTKSTASQQRLFAKLSIGGDFPKLPFQVDALKTSYKGKEIAFKGHHLTYTCKEGKFYEWGLYIPSEQIDAEYALLLTYYMVYSDNVDEPNFEGKFRLGLTPNILIKGREEFAELFVGAIKEFCDSQNISEEITYETVMQLTKKLRD